MHNGNKGIDYFLYIDHTASTVVLRGGGGVPHVKNPWGGHLKINAIFNTILQKVYQFLRLVTIIKLLFLIQSFYFTHILHSSESLVYNRFYIVYDFNHYIIVYNQFSIYSGLNFLSPILSVLPLILPLQGHLIIIHTCMPSTVLYVIHVDLVVIHS